MTHGEKPGEGSVGLSSGGCDCNGCTHEATRTTTVYVMCARNERAAYKSMHHRRPIAHWGAAPAAAARGIATPQCAGRPSPGYADGVRQPATLGPQERGDAGRNCQPFGGAVLE